MKSSLHCTSIHVTSKVKTIFVCLEAICISSSINFAHFFFLLAGDLFLIDFKVLFTYERSEHLVGNISGKYFYTV